MGWKRKLLITTILLGGISYGAYYSYDSGLLEHYMSTTRIPFEHLRVHNRLSGASERVKDTQRKSIAEYKVMLAPISEVFGGQESRPAFDTARVNSAEWDKILDPVYGVEFTYVTSARMTGLIQDKDGWAPLLTLSVYNDSEAVRNITVKVFERNGRLLPEVVRDDVVHYEYAEVPDDFNIAYLDLATSTDEKFFKNKIWENASASFYSTEDVAKLKDSDNQVKTRVLFIYGDSEIQVTRKYGTANQLFKVDRVYALDTIAANKNLFLVPMSIKAIPGS